MSFSPFLLQFFVYQVLNIDQVWNIVLDAVGGVLSIVQLFLDSALADAERPLNGVLGNISKLVLGLISLCFDAAFITQHFQYRGRSPLEEPKGSESERRETDPLLAE